MKALITTLSAFAIAAACADSARGSLTVGCPTANIEEFRTIATFAKSIGATHVDASQVEYSLWQWDANRKDPYPNWSMHRPSVFKFIVPPELSKYIPADYAARNLHALEERAKVLRELGLKADFTGMEPAYFPEQAYLDHPKWRGARCDQTRRSRSEYYAPCVENPEVRRMYVEAVAKLCAVCPFDRFKFRCNDSGSALCWSESLYPGKNGPAACRSVPYGKRVADALSIFQEGAAKAGLPGAKVNFRASLGPENAIFPWMKPGQSVNNKTAQGTAAAYVVGFPNRFADCSAPILGMTRLPYLVSQLQTAQQNPDSDIEVGLEAELAQHLRPLLELAEIPCRIVGGKVLRQLGRHDELEDRRAVHRPVGIGILPVHVPLPKGVLDLACVDVRGADGLGELRDRAELVDAGDRAPDRQRAGRAVRKCHGACEDGE